MALSQKVIDKIATPGVYQDKNGLSLKVRPAGNKPAGSRSWIFRYQFNGERHDIGLGSFPEVTLADARKKVANLRAQIANGIDPLAQRKDESIAAISVRDESVTFIERHRAGWSTKHASQWLNSLTQHVFPIVGELAVSTASTEDVKKVLDPIWNESPTTARRVRNRLERVFDAAIANGHRKAENPAVWKGHLENLMSQNKKAPSPLASLPYHQLPEFMRALAEDHSRAARCLEFLILTACRTTEALQATWDEVDWINRVWNIPAERMKGKVIHQVPLSEEAIAVLKDVGTRGRSELIFPADGNTRVELADNAMRRTMRALGQPKATPHGMRATFRTWVEEETSFSWEVAEKALAHVVGNATSRTYIRGNLLEKRRPMMAKWGKFVMSAINPHTPVMGNRPVPNQQQRTFL